MHDRAAVHRLGTSWGTSAALVSIPRCYELAYLSFAAHALSAVPFGPLSSLAIALLHSDRKPGMSVSAVRRSVHINLRHILDCRFRWLDSIFRPDGKSVARYQNADTHPLQAKSVSSVDVGMLSLDRHVNTRGIHHDRPGNDSSLVCWKVYQFNIRFAYL